jgi:hypothetical protein
MISMPPIAIRPEDDSDSSWSDPDDEDLNDCFPSLFQRGKNDDDKQEGDNEQPAPTGRAGLTPEQTVLMFLDWMSSNKVPDATGSTAWTLILAASPVDVGLPSFWKIKHMLQAHQNKHVKRIEVLFSSYVYICVSGLRYIHRIISYIQICKNDCIAYYDTKHLPAPFDCKKSHRTKCPKCNEPRYIKDPVANKMIPVKVIYHFPMKYFVRGLYGRAELVPNLWFDSGDPEEGNVKRSREFKQKVLDNVHMNGDHRNLALVGTTDGVPFFDDQRRGGWPFFFRLFIHMFVYVNISYFM